jgi:hypothetical protein
VARQPTSRGAADKTLLRALQRAATNLELSDQANHPRAQAQKIPEGFLIFPVHSGNIIAYSML